MEEIDWVADMMKHSNEELIGYLYTKILGVAKVYARASEDGDPALLYCAAGDLNDMRAILKAMNARNAEKLYNRITN
jgi:hypothetical protein